MTSSARVMFFAEAVTLAHVARPIALARSLHPDSHDVVMACNSRYGRFTEGESWTTLPLDSIDSRQFLNALANGTPVYDVETLRRYVQQDLELIERVKPDLIVGDFRLSLSVSCRLARVPYAAVTNAYWSPFLANGKYLLPVLPITRFLPLPLVRTVFDVVRPAAFAMHCRPLNQLRLENGLTSLGNNLRNVYTDADHVLYADVPQMFLTKPLPATHHHLGSILWSPPQSMPPWWAALSGGPPIIYVTMGSSGRADVFDTVLQSLGRMPVSVAAATAGAPLARAYGSNVHVADYLPGVEAAARSRLVICNGGSASTCQALVAGVPVLGIASNMDQFLNMAAIVESGAGLVLRADRVETGAIETAVQTLLETPRFGAAAALLATTLKSIRAEETFPRWIDSVLAD